MNEPRDLFAAAALQGLLASDAEVIYEGALNRNPRHYAQLAFALADAMCKERRKKDEPVRPTIDPDHDLGGES